MAAPRILAFAGSVRRGSFNQQLLRLGVAAAREAGAEVTRIDLSQYELPLYNADLEQDQGLPQAALALKQQFFDHDGLLLACPEYNSSVTPLLKNTIDWVSRPAPGEGTLAAYRGKTAALMSASPGRLGGLRGLVHVRAILGNIGVLVLPDQLAVAQAGAAFTDDGRLKDEKQQASVENLAQSLVETLSRLTR